MNNRRTCAWMSLPFGTRGGLAVRSDFPADGEYCIKVTFVGRSA